MRYLYHAFFARPEIPLLRLPWNAVAVGAAWFAGFWDPSIWMVAGVGEFVYLLTLASNSGFRQSIQDRKFAALREDTEDSRRKLKSQVGGAARQRYIRLEEKRKKLEAVYEQDLSDDLFAQSNREALQKLTWLFLKLLVAQRNLIVAPQSDARDLEKQIAALDHELANLTSAPLRESKSATLRLLRERLDNVEHRQTSLAEIEADLARIETQLDFALEEATLRGRPTAISADVVLTSHLLGNLDDSSLGGVSESASRHVSE